VSDAAGVRFGRLAQAFGLALALYVRLVAATCRLSGSVSREQVVLAFWHEFNLLALVASMTARPDLPHASFSTQGFRGVVSTTLLRRTRSTIRVVPLPPENDRSAARDFSLRMARMAADGYSLVVTPDGPFGPYRVAKPGTLIIARASGLAVLPWAVSARPSFRLGRRWDRQIVPLPFCRLRLVEGAPLRVAARERLSPRLGELQAGLDQVSGRAGPAP
jgi:lysophospholipid acyltransferase (LPLAT)-like uncharacterized protein